MLTDINLNTRGKLVSTTDMNLACKLGRDVSIRGLVGSYPARYEIDNGRVIVYSRSELYEIAV